MVKYTYAYLQEFRGAGEVTFRAVRLNTWNVGSMSGMCLVQFMSKMFNLSDVVSY